jgi:4,5-dihydroxyphthalate decarboxylase
MTMACWNYDRTRALADGRVQPDGIDLNYLTLPVEETFFPMLRHREFDAAEMSLSSYVVSLFTPERPFIAIPVFPSRFFRHSSIYVHAGSGIREPRDLVGKKVGTPEYQMTAPVWIRGILADEYGVPVNSVTYYTGGLESTGRSEKLKLDLPPDIRVKPIAADQTLASMLATGADAIDIPQRERDGKAAVRRFRTRRTRVFPADRHLPHHAYRHHPPRPVRA